ncbi:MAG: formylglycine-generating enzyme family protein [Candidatus Sericytochromatia bacterium]|nr:formylglycine-generating enzyme family protein [Candidatus Sericytochromatia bacterium]
MKRKVWQMGLLMMALSLLSAAFPPTSVAQVPNSVLVPAGEFIPQFSPRPGQKSFQIKAFWLDRQPVTQAEFLAFLKAHPRWQRSQIPQIFQEGRYLAHWQGDLTLPVPTRAVPEPEKQAVTQVSWMAARAFCTAQGKRLPSLLEWEYAADVRNPDSLLWYSQAGVGIPAQAGASPANAKGIRDLHLMYEWVEDFNQVIMTNDSREGSEKDSSLFCGNSGNATDRMNYAAFTRFAFWSSLQTAYTLKNLGFRCARDR